MQVYQYVYLTQAPSLHWEMRNYHNVSPCFQGEQSKRTNLCSREEGLIRGDSSRIIILQSLETLYLR